MIPPSRPDSSGESSIPCPFCQTPNPARVIRDLGDWIWIVGDHQFYPGYSLLVAKRHVREPFELTVTEQATMSEQIARAGHAVQRAYGPRKLNYAALGNQVEHLHWHLVPRYPDDPQPGANPWVNERNFEAHATTPALAREVAARLLAMFET